MRSNSGQAGSNTTFTESARRAQIMNCAIEVLAESGYSGASLAEIARRAGISKSVVLYYFSGKDELLASVVFDVYGRAGQAIAESLSREVSPGDKIAAYVRTNLHFLEEHAAEIRAVVEIVSNARGADGTHSFAPQGEDPVLAHLEQLLREGLDSGDFRRFDAHHLAIIIRSAIDTASGRLVVDPSFDLPAYTRELLSVVELATGTHRAEGSS
ncbi:TetR/AcrR family transcriptional regulator [Kocuria sp. cx-116]|uniref:TetR/AcrR family transcriptional regulator n=1 Tax=Kocuria sp. cx-116 TaxID=2771378 RepID=UPI0016833F7E|nr:TetR/AcrR family transcriptional regulator [Kocuria sp. cx-116]MBD2761901.1 TetR/AcrR family transcriptional regulator [Kocuria sp. cx-116]